MTRLTKSQLVAELEAAHAAYERLAAEVAGLKAAAQPIVQPTHAAPQPKAAVCAKCGGSGKWYGHGHTENGVFVGETGVCYACKGKGMQTRSDVRRCDTYWQHHTYSEAGRAVPTAPRAKFVSAKAELVQRYYAAHPEARSVTAAQLTEFAGSSV